MQYILRPERPNFVIPPPFVIPAKAGIHVFFSYPQIPPPATQYLLFIQTVILVCRVSSQLYVGGPLIFD